MTMEMYQYRLLMSYRHWIRTGLASHSPWWTMARPGWDQDAVLTLDMVRLLFQLENP